MTAQGGLDRGRIHDLDARELARFREARPATLAMLGRARQPRLLRIWLANRGVWDAVTGAGPTVPVPAAHADVDRYLQAYAELLEELTR